MTPAPGERHTRLVRDDLWRAVVAPLRVKPAGARLRAGTDAIYSEPTARTRKRRERAAALIEPGKVDHNLLAELRARFGLEA